MSVQISSEILAKLREVNSKPYRDQAVFYLNAFWVDGAEAEAEDVYTVLNAFIKTDHVKGKNGCELNEVAAHHFLQSIGRTLTAMELRAELRKVDLDANGEMALCEYLLFKNNRDVVKLITNPQGGTEESLKQMQEVEAKLEQLNEAYEKLQAELEAQKVSEKAAKDAEKASKDASESAAKAEADAVAAEKKAQEEQAFAVDAEAKASAAEAKLKVVEEELRKVEEEARQVDAALKAEEDAFHGECARLDALTKDETVGIVKRNTAVQQLASLKAADPLPLKKAKITQEAVVRRLAKATAAAAAETEIAAAATKAASEARAHADAAAVASSEARASAEVARKQAEDDLAKAIEARHAAEEATKAVECSIEAVKTQTAELEATLAELKKAPVVAHGMIWMAERDVKEKKKYLPQRLQ